MFEDLLKVQTLEKRSFCTQFKNSITHNSQGIWNKKNNPNIKMKLQNMNLFCGILLKSLNILIIESSYL